jgi:hypothetical protein
MQLQQHKGVNAVSDVFEEGWSKVQPMASDLYGWQQLTQ